MWQWFLRFDTHLFPASFAGVVFGTSSILGTFYLDITCRVTVAGVWLVPTWLMAVGVLPKAALNGPSYISCLTLQL